MREYGADALATNEPLLLRIVPGRASPARARRAPSPSPTRACRAGRWRSSSSRGAGAAGARRRRQPGRARRWPRSAGRSASTSTWSAGEQAQPRGDDAALVVASHGREEEPALNAALRLGVPYVGLIASRIRGAAVLASLDVTDEQRSRVHSPAGLDIGGRTAAEIALSVLAELVAERRAAERHAPARRCPPSAIDPVCGMTVAAVDSSPHVTIDGTTTWFCCAGCRTAFLDDPARYAAAS